MHIVLDGPIWPVPSLGLSGLVSTIPCASLVPCGPSQTEVQVRDNSPTHPHNPLPPPGARLRKILTRAGTTWSKMPS